jgi:hypothetical protein
MKRILMLETGVVLTPDACGQQLIQRRDRPTPRQRARDLLPLGVLVERRAND